MLARYTKCSAVCCRSGPKHFHVFPTSEELKTQYITFSSDGNIPTIKEKSLCNFTICLLLSHSLGSHTLYFYTAKFTLFVCKVYEHIFMFLQHYVVKTRPLESFFKPQMASHKSQKWLCSDIVYIHV